MLAIEHGIEYMSKGGRNKKSTKRQELIDTVSKLEYGDSVFVPREFFKQVTVRVRVSEMRFDPPRSFICQTKPDGVRIYRVKEA